MTVSATNLRQNIYGLLDQVLETGQPILVERKGQLITITPAKQTDLFARLRKHPKVMKGKPENFVHLDWSDEWRHDIP